MRDLGERILAGRLFSDVGQRLQGESLLGCLRKRDDDVEMPLVVDWKRPHHLILSSNSHNHLVNKDIWLPPFHQYWEG